MHSGDKRGVEEVLYCADGDGSLDRAVEKTRSENGKHISSTTKRRALEAQSLDSKALESLPCAKMYEKSYMHRDIVSHIATTKTGFVITISTDGRVKFWKKRDKGIEFVKTFRAHLGPILAHAVSLDGHMFATTSADNTIKIFDIVNFDMIGIIDTEFVPGTLCWIKDPLDQTACIVVTDSDTPTAYVFDPYSGTKPKRIINRIHRQPILLVAYNPVVECAVSVDKGGMVEYWTLEEPFALPESIDFKLKSQTDLYEFKKSKCIPNSLVFSPDFELFACTSATDSTIRIFRFATGKLYRKYDESIGASNSIQQSDEGGRFKLDDMEFGRRLATENELLKSSDAKASNAIFDASGRLLLFPSLFGIKVVSLSTNKVVCVLGKPEPHRFLDIALCQNLPGDTAPRPELAAPSNPESKQGTSASDPTLFCTAYKRKRFYMFTREEPDHLVQDNARDVFNEKPTREEASLAVMPSNQRSATAAILHTTLGDIHLALFPEHAPKAVENFATHSENGYYNGIIFHRVIKRFMIQTGDPLGDGTGGESIWGSPFADEFSPMLRHNHPYTLSMANSGPRTNGSQFFITTIESAPWLDDKHTIFGRVVSGSDVIHLIESAKTDKRDKPLEDISILNIQIQHRGSD
ncbi:Peptidyl-prolyl cis-trans isomerase cyp15 [Coemansia sp. RSA 1813]|nr:Peptidyl-prolyl cis-trans isomerase cyp15 [Coemansia sp. RSA 1646]KAJ1768853.1 Peptidyl-prolyl cis-trans isomerase cyp15 [Coemansia sp. RSA 1843]KAJ2086910.1 Peptidyl-prolyl cis-trans isomerase cyp15 [Coemansia sp. RSA 986]KAJ2211611.1 Peptidyl-prolyl cis-trans isomerase cyp15 [Coemansia sp. RSA 487]KAJ2565191.1 Peptidyl-prolyl cis-trans isomerase cyp15 [Coemansia sp. RSA 1813]